MSDSGGAEVKREIAMKTFCFVSALLYVTLVATTSSQAREYRLECEGTQYISDGTTYRYHSRIWFDSRTGEIESHMRFGDGSTINAHENGVRISRHSIVIGGLHVDRDGGRFDTNPVYKAGLRHTNHGHCWGSLIYEDRHDDDFRDR